MEFGGESVIGIEARTCVSRFKERKRVRTRVKGKVESYRTKSRGAIFVDKIERSLARA